MKEFMLVGIAAVAIVLVNVWWRTPKHEWHRGFWPDRMQRKINGKWEYRRPTAQEERERFEDEAW